MKHLIRLRNDGMPKESFEILHRTAERVLTRRAVTLTEESDTATYTVTCTLDRSLRNERFIIRTEKNGASISAADDCALFAALGRFLRESRFDGRGAFCPPPPQTVIDFTPEKPLRGMYFATHFHNFYHNAPLERIYEVVEDLALRGCNNLLVWFDMHHFSSMQDPDALSLLYHLRAILSYAKRIGMRISLTMLSNEAFSSSPSHLRAEWTAQNGYVSEPVAHYHVELCPSKAGGIEEILKQRREMLSAFADLDIDYVVYWPYDQGGCTCKGCAPWGANGFLKLLPHFKKLVAEMMPSTRVIVSAWYFDRFTSGEWEGLCRALPSELFADIPYVMAFFPSGEIPEVLRKTRLPDTVRFIDFPEISMFSCSPWGGYGASHLTRFLDKTNRTCGALYEGGFPYSEGIFEDANKFIELAFYTGEYKNAEDALRAYVKYEFCCDDEALFEAILRTETGLARKRSRSAEHIRIEIKDPSGTGFVLDTLEHYRSILPQTVTDAPAFRLYYLRAVIDDEIVKNDGYAIRSERAQAAMREVNELYFANDNTNEWVKAPYGR